MSDRFTDPFRDVVSEQKGGADQVTLSCGHTVIVGHRHQPRKRCRCHHQGCRVWKDRP